MSWNQSSGIERRVEPWEKRRRVVGSTCCLLIALLLVGCVNQDTWKPTVDPHNDPKSETLAVDETECRQSAKDGVGGSTTKETAKGAGAGAAVGAVAGAVIGAVAGSPGAGAAAGAAAGGAAGGTYKNIDASKEFQTIFRNCMKERGHTVLDAEE